MKTNLVFLKQNVNENPSSIDRIRFFVKDESCSCYKSLIKLSRIRYDNTKYHPNKRFCFSNKLLIQGKKILLERTKESKEVKLTFFKATTYIQEFLIPVFKKHNVTPIPSCLELSQDFYQNSKEQVIILQDEMIRLTIQPYNHRSSFVLSGKAGSKTLYTQDIRGKKGLRLSKFARIYLRNTYENQKTDDTGNSDPYVRLEIILNRTILKESEWEYPITPNQIINLNIYKYIRFVGFNHSKFESYLSKRTNLKRRIEYHLNKTGRSLKNLNEYPVYEIINILKKFKEPHYEFLLNYKHETNMLQESLKQLKGYDVGRIKRRKSIAK